MNPTYNVRYFGLLGERRGLSEECFTHTVTTAAGLYEALNAEYHLGLAIADFRVAVNDEFVPWDHILKDGDSIALLPPMSGG